MQQNETICQQLTKQVRDAIREEADALGISAPGAIKISLVPYTKEADALLGELSEFERQNGENALADDVAIYEFSYALIPEHDFAMNESSDYANMHIKKRRLICGIDYAAGAFVWEDYLDITLRVYGAEGKNYDLVKAGMCVLPQFFRSDERDEGVSLTVDGAPI